MSDTGTASCSECRYGRSTPRTAGLRNANSQRQQNRRSCQPIDPDCARHPALLEWLAIIKKHTTGRPYLACRFVVQHIPVQIHVPWLIIHRHRWQKHCQPLNPFCFHHIPPTTRRTAECSPVLTLLGAKRKALASAQPSSEAESAVSMPAPSIAQACAAGQGMAGELHAEVDIVVG